MNEPRCVVCQDEGMIDNNMGEMIPCEMCQFIHGLPRPVVVRFADDMEQRLRENDHKGGWSGGSKQHMANILAKATGDLLQSLKDNQTVQHVTTRAADVANIAMMIANNEQSGLWPKKGYVIQEITTGKYAKHDGSNNADFPFVYVDRADHAESYVTLDHALYVAFWAMEIGKQYRVIDFDHGGVQYIHIGGGNWKTENSTDTSEPIPHQRTTE